MISAQVTIHTPHGLHLRPAGELAEEAGMKSHAVHISEEMEYEDLNNISKWRLMEMKMKGIVEGEPEVIKTGG